MKKYTKTIKTPYQRVKEWRERNKDKRKAQMLIYSGIRNGSIKQKKCFKCNSIFSEAHHEDYSKPLDVVWLCKKHHTERHNEIRYDKLLDNL